MEEVLRRFTLDYFGRGKHKTTPEAFFEKENALLLDVRSREEADSLAISLACHGNVESLNIPIHEIPDRIGEIPQGQGDRGVLPGQCPVSHGLRLSADPGVRGRAHCDRRL